MDTIITFLIVLLILYGLWTLTPLHCIASPLGCSINNLNDFVGGIKSAFN